MATNQPASRSRPWRPSVIVPTALLVLLALMATAKEYLDGGFNGVAALLPCALLAFAIVVLLAGMGRGAHETTELASLQSSGARLHSVTQLPATRFADVAGYLGVKQEISEVVDFLRNPEMFRAMGARIPKGVLLVGPPGTGKTLLARAVAGEAGVPFISMNGSAFVEMFAGVGASRVRSLFATARQQQPCIIFVDEIDAIGGTRGAGSGESDERDQALNQLLAEMDGFEPTDGVVVLAATNRPEVLDPALLRAGRFDRQVVVSLPTRQERAAILVVHTKAKPLARNVDLEFLAGATPGLSGADLSNLVNEAALLAVRLGRDTISSDEMDRARDRLQMGLERASLALSEEETRIIAHHEAGHAVLAQLLAQTDPIYKVTILPTGFALGSTQQIPARDRYVTQRPYLEDRLAVMLGGRAAEELIFGAASTGVHDDLVAATNLAYRMVREWGMSGRLGQRAWESQPERLPGQAEASREYSDETANRIDEEIEAILDSQAQRARRTLEEHEDALRAVADALLVREILRGDEVAALVTGKRGETLGGIPVAALVPA